jgi:two-component system CheB/CheR fusion protein
MFSTHYRSPRRPEDRALRLLDLLARQAADIIERAQSESALSVANAQLMEADRRKNEFLAVLSHELRNPLAPIRNSTYILERSAPGGEQARRAVAVIDRQAGQLARLVDDLLDVTRITRNKVQLQRQIVDLNQLVRHAAEDQRSLFEKSEIHLHFHPAPRPVLVNADRNRLAQIIGNLLQNAAKFTGQGGETHITISADATGKQAVVQVADTGVGMTPEMVSRLFQPFSQADSTLDRSKGGLGLGLALAKGLVELHGGTIAAASAGLGQGAEFVVRLPLAMEAAASPQPSESAANSRRRVLIIEDNIDAADSLRDVLAFGDHEVEVAYNGPQGIAKAQEFLPEVVLCDIGLPGMDGYEVARAFRADEALKGTFLAALSGYALPEDLQRASEAGFDRYIPKPPSIEQIAQVLEAVRAEPAARNARVLQAEKGTQ